MATREHGCDQGDLERHHEHQRERTEGPDLRVAHDCEAPLAVASAQRIGRVGESVKVDRARRQRPGADEQDGRRSVVEPSLETARSESQRAAERRADER